MKERKEAEESRKNAEKYEMEALIAREQRTLELERTERMGKVKMLAAVTQFNKELVRLPLSFYLTFSALQKNMRYYARYVVRYVSKIMTAVTFDS